jgi:uncharacterized protein YcaQ
VVEIYEDGGLCENAAELVRKIEELGPVESSSLRKQSRWVAPLPGKRHMESACSDIKS